MAMAIHSVNSRYTTLPFGRPAYQLIGNRTTSSLPGTKRTRRLLICTVSGCIALIVEPGRYSSSSYRSRHALTEFIKYDATETFNDELVQAEPVQQLQSRLMITGQRQLALDIGGGVRRAT